MPRPLAALLALSLVGLATSSAAAATLEDPTTGLRLTLDAPGARVCVLLPVASRIPGGCVRIDVEAAATKIQQTDSTVIWAALLIFPDWFLIAGRKSIGRSTLHSHEDMVTFLADLKDGSAAAGIPREVIRLHGDSPGELYNLGKVNDVDYLRTRLDYEVAADDRVYGGSRTLLYILNGERAAEVFTFSTDPVHAAAARPIVDAIMGSVVLPPLRVEGYGDARAVILARTLGHLTVPVVAALACLFLVLRSWWRKRGGARG